MHMWKKKKGGNSGKFGCLTRCTSFPPMTNVWFLSFKKVWKAVWLWRVLAICLWYREENEWSCEEYAFSTVDGDSSRYVSFLHLLFCRSVDKLLNTIAPFLASLLCMWLWLFLMPYCRLQLPETDCLKFQIQFYCLITVYFLPELVKSNSFWTVLMNLANP